MYYPLTINKTKWLKFLLAFISCLLFRLLPFRPPNIEPILATQMPIARVYGPYASFFFGFLSIVLYDITTGLLGIWTLATASAYGVLGVGAFFYFNKREVGIRHYVTFAIIGTLFFDAVTGLLVGPLIFDQRFLAALVGQIPFTAAHLLGNVAFAILLSPAVYHFMIKTKKIHISIISLLNSKII